MSSSLEEIHPFLNTNDKVMCSYGEVKTVVKKWIEKVDREGG